MKTLLIFKAESAMMRKIVSEALSRQGIDLMDTSSLSVNTWLHIAARSSESLSVVVTTTDYDRALRGMVQTKGEDIFYSPYAVATMTLAGTRNNPIRVISQSTSSLAFLAPSTQAKALKRFLSLVLESDNEQEKQ